MKLADLPNAMTWFRLAAAPLVVLLLALPGGFWAWLAFSLFVAAAVTDFLDGYLARKLNVVSPLGTMLDPIADKVMVILALAALCARDPGSLLFIVPITVIIFREVFVSGMREYLGQKAIALPVTALAKWKTTLQLLAIGLLLLPISGAQPIGLLVLWAAALATGITGWQYFKHASAVWTKDGQ